MSEESKPVVTAMTTLEMHKNLPRQDSNVPINQWLEVFNIWLHNNFLVTDTELVFFDTNKYNNNTFL